MREALHLLLRLQIFHDTISIIDENSPMVRSRLIDLIKSCQLLER